MTPKFLDAIKAIYYKDDMKEQEAELGGDFRKFIRSETDYYFRKTDGVTLGLTRWNHLGEQLEDWVYDKVEINRPIPDQEFSLPKGGIKIAKSIDESIKIIGQLMAAERAKARKNPRPRFRKSASQSCRGRPICQKHWSRPKLKIKLCCWISPVPIGACGASSLRMTSCPSRNLPVTPKPT